MLRDLIREGGLYSMANLLTKGVSLLLIPFYTAYFSPEDYGVIDMFTVFGFFVTGILTLQLSQGLARYVADSRLKRIEKIEYASSAIWSSFIFLFLALVGLSFCYELIVNLLFTPGLVSEELYLLALGTIFLNAVFYFLGVYFRFTRQTKLFSVLSFAHALLGILLTWLFVAVFDQGIKSIYYAYIIVAPLLIALQFYVLRYRIKFIIKSRKLKKLLHFSLPLIPLSIATILMNFTDRIFIKHFINIEGLGFDGLGIYGIGTKFSSVIGIFIGGFSMAIAPIVFERYDRESTKLELKEIFNLFISVSTIGLLLLSFFAKETVMFFTTDSYLPAYEIMPLLYFTAIFLGLNMFSQGLQIEKKTVQMAIITVIFAAMNVGLNFFLVPKYKLEGAALATLISTVGLQVSMFLASQKYYQIPINYFKTIGTVSLAFILMLLVQYTTVDKYWLSLIFRIFLIFGFAATLYFTGVLDVHKFVNFIKNRLNKP